MKNDGVPAATAARLPLYVSGLKDLARERVELASSQTLAASTGMQAHLIRKDLSYLGSFGKRGVGYPVDQLLQQLSSYINLARLWRVSVVGCGRLGSALASYLAAGDSNYHLVAVFDCSAHKIGTNVGNLQVLSWRAIPSASRERSVDIAIIATPPLSAQGVANLLVEGGVHLILNFSTVQLTVPGDVSVRNMDISAEMQALTLQHPRKRRAKAQSSARPVASQAQRQQ